MQIHGRTIPWRAILLVATLALTVVLVITLRNLLDPQARAHAAEVAETLQPVDVVAGALWRLIPPVLLVAAAATGLAIAWRRYGLKESVGAHYLVEAQRAQQTPLPSSVRTVHVHTSQLPLSRQPVAPPLLTAQAPDVCEIVVPSFRELLEGGLVGVDNEGRQHPLILGYGEHGPITGGWKSLYSSGLGGLQGSGKTWTAAFLLAQSAINGAQLVICDPHAGDEESLAARVQPLAPAFLCDIADDERSILQALKLADEELQRRKDGDPNRRPLIVAVDEWTSLRRGELAEQLPRFVEDFSTEGRKLNIHIMLLGQRWDKESVGPFRNTLASSYVHRMRADEARMMTGLRASALPDDTLQLEPGAAYLVDTRGTLHRVQIPLMRPEDVARVGDRLRNGMAEPRRPIGFPIPSRQSQNSHEVAKESPAENDGYSASQSLESLSPEAARIVALFLEGKDAGAIVTELTGMTSKNGKPYLTKLAEVQAVIRDTLKQRLQAA